MTVTEVDVERPLESLWRGLLVYRVLTLVSSAAVVLAALGDYALPGAVVGVLALMVVWTAVTGWVYVSPPRAGWRGRVAIADLAVTVAVMGTTPLVQTPAQYVGDAPVMGSIWTPGAVLACAIAFGVRGGLAGAVVVSGALVLFQSDWRAELPDVQLLVLAGLAIGFAATVLRRSAERLRRVAAAEAAMAERERLSRAVHDGVLQVLGYVRRRGAELGGPAEELGTLAGEQEFALRAMLVSTAPADAGSAADDDRRDLAAALRMFGSATVSVSAPAHAVELPAHAVDELVAVVRAALANVAVHVGPGAQAWVLLEDVGDAVEISVRDDGPGIPEGRLAQADAEGRLGVARSMRGRVLDLGGTIDCETGPDRGTEWVVRVPRKEER